MVTVVNCVHHFDMAAFRLRGPGAGARRPSCSSNRTRSEGADDLGKLLPGLHEPEQRPTASRDPGSRQPGPAGSRWIAKHKPSAIRARAGPSGPGQGRGAPLPTFARYTPRERSVHSDITGPPASPMVCWVTKHLLVVIGASRRNQEGRTARQPRANQAAGGRARTSSFVSGGGTRGLPAAGWQRRRYGRPGQGLPKADRQGAAAERRAEVDAAKRIDAGVVRPSQARRRSGGAASGQRRSDSSGVAAKPAGGPRRTTWWRPT